ncbi:MAG: ABC transporter substrate-binding protein [Candidatus Hydrogenedentota bacterium]
MLIALGVAVAGCGGKANDALVFAVGGTNSELQVWQEVVAEFEAETGIDVEVRRQPSDSSQQLQTLIVSLDSANSDPDVFMMDVAWVGLFAASDWCHPIENIETAPFFERVLNLVDRRDGQLIALPVYMDGGLLYYRTDLFEKYGFDAPPKTYDQLIEMCRTAQEGERAENPSFYGYVWQGAQYEGLVCNFLEFAGKKGGFLAPSNEEPRPLMLDREVNRKALKLMHDLIWEHEVSPPNTYTEMKEEEVRMFFQEGDALFERNWPYAWSDHQSEGSPVYGKVGVARLPAMEAGQDVSTLGGWHIGISKFSDRKEEAQRFVEYVTSKATLKKMVLRLGWNPGRSDLYDDADILEKAPHFPQLKEIFEHAKPRPLVPYYNQLSQIAQQRISACLAGKVSAAEALSTAQEEIETLVRNYGDTDRLPGESGTENG